MKYNGAKPLALHGFYSKSISTIFVPIKCIGNAETKWFRGEERN
jgi:hypothetical protein